MKIKICGIKNLDEANIVNSCMPDFIGFIFAKSKREITYEKAVVLSKMINPKIQKVGVFTDKTTDEILKYKKIIDIVQFHGKYSENDIEKIKKEGLKTIKVVKVIENEYEINTNADYILFDTYKENIQGGTNETFNWGIKIKANRPFFVAGGINASNILVMARKLHPYGADVSSGVEVQGIKTKEKVAGIIKIAKGI